MEYRPLGSSGFFVSVLAFGAWQIGDTGFWGSHDQRQAEATVGTALDAGINLFDTAELYGKGESERVLGRALGTRRGEILIASKVSPEHCAPTELRAACEASLSRLNTTYIDLYQVHWAPRHVPFEDVQGELTRLREEGKIRVFGVSNFGPRDLAQWPGASLPVSNQLGYNIAFRAIEYHTLPLCRKNNIGVLAYMPLMQGLLAGRWKTIGDIPPMRRRTRHFAGHRTAVRHGEDGCESLLMETLAELDQLAQRLGVEMAAMCLAWVIAQPGITSAIVGARAPEQLTRNLGAVQLYLGPAVIARLNEIAGPLKNRLGANTDMWETAANARIR